MPLGMCTRVSVPHVSLKLHLASPAISLVAIFGRHSAQTAQASGRHPPVPLVEAGHATKSPAQLVHVEERLAMLLEEPSAERLGEDVRDVVVGADVIDLD